MSKNQSIIGITFGFWVVQIIVSFVVYRLFGVKPMFLDLLDISIYLYIALSCLVFIPIYILSGYIVLSVIGYRPTEFSDLFKSMMIITVVLLLGLVLGIVFYHSNVTQEILRYYIMFNYPMGFSISGLPVDDTVLNPIVVLTAILPTLSFFFGGFIGHRRKIKGGHHE